MVKAYAVNCNDAWLIPNDEPKEGHYVKYEDYAALAAECAALKKIVEFVTDLDNEPQYHDDGIGRSLEDRSISSIYDAARYGWDEAMERIYGEVIPCADEIETPATDRFLAEQRAQGVEMFADSKFCTDEGQSGALEFASQLRNEVNQ